MTGKEFNEYIDGYERYNNYFVENANKSRTDMIYNGNVIVHSDKIYFNVIKNNICYNPSDKFTEYLVLLNKINDSDPKMVEELLTTKECMYSARYSDLHKKVTIYVEDVYMKGIKDMLIKTKIPSSVIDYCIVPFLVSR